MRPDPFSAAAKPFSVPYEESLESRSARKAQKSQSFTSQPSSTLTVEFASWSLEDTWSSCSSPDGQKTSVSFPEAEWSAKATDQQQPASFGQGAPRARRNSSSRSTLVALGRKISSSSQASSLEDIQSTIDRAVENGSTDVDLSHRNIEVLPECIGDLRHCTSLSQSSGRRDFRKTRSESALALKPTQSSQLNLQLPGNLLTSSSFPSAFFDIQNLTVLSLRNNKLEVLPDGIGSLVNLRTLNISSNNLQYLPSNILNLQLDTFLCQPNDFLPVPAEATVHPESKRLMAPKVVHTPVPSLAENCLRLLLSRADSVAIGHHLKEYPHLAARLSADYSNSSHKHRKCANDQHASKPAFVEPAVERYEWCRVVAGCVVGVPEIPIRYTGCQRTCLDFLEQAPNPITSTDDDWTL